MCCQAIGHHRTTEYAHSGANGNGMQCVVFCIAVHASVGCTIASQRKVQRLGAMMRSKAIKKSGGRKGSEQPPGYKTGGQRPELAFVIPACIVYICGLNSIVFHGNKQLHPPAIAHYGGGIRTDQGKNGPDAQFQ